MRFYNIIDAWIFAYRTFGTDLLPLSGLCFDAKEKNALDKENAGGTRVQCAHVRFQAHESSNFNPKR